MQLARRLSITPGTGIALVALFFALGGSAFAVGERIHGPSVAQQRRTGARDQLVGAHTPPRPGVVRIGRPR